MRNAVFLAGIWVGIIIFAYGVVYWGSGPTEIPYLPDIPFTETVYADSEGRYDVMLPAGWAASEEANRTVIAGPEREISGAIVVIDGVDLEAAVNDAWTAYRFDAMPVPELVTVGSMFDSDGPDWHVTYQLPDDGAAVAKAYGGEGSIAVLIVEGPSEMLEKRTADIEAIHVTLLDGEIKPEPPVDLDEAIDEVDGAADVDGVDTVEEAEPEPAIETSDGEAEVELPIDEAVVVPEEPQTRSETLPTGDD